MMMAGVGTKYGPTDRDLLALMTSHGVRARGIQDELKEIDIGFVPGNAILAGTDWSAQSQVESRFRRIARGNTRVVRRTGVRASLQDAGERNSVSVRAIAGSLGRRDKGKDQVKRAEWHGEHQTVRPPSVANRRTAWQTRRPRRKWWP